jgi:hypothetical protein
LNAESVVYDVGPGRIIDP